jgi:transcriptional regulator with XRE-family HTH domain
MAEELTRPNEGARYLEARLQYGDAQKLAERLKVDRTLISKWTGAKRKPNAKLRAKLEDDPTTQIPWRLWDEDPTTDPIPPLPEPPEVAPGPTFPASVPPAASGDR